MSLEAAGIGAERFASKLRVAEAMTEGTFLSRESQTIADCVASALSEFADQFYGVDLPAIAPSWLRGMPASRNVPAPLDQSIRPRC